MPGQAGYNFTIAVSTTKSGTYFEIPSSDGSFNETADVLNPTDTTNAGYHQRLLGLLDASANTEANWSATDPALVAIRSAMRNRTELWVKVLPNGLATEGSKFPVVVENFNISTSVTDLSKVSVSFQGNGAVVPDDEA